MLVFQSSHSAWGASEAGGGEAGAWLGIPDWDSGTGTMEGQGDIPLLLVASTPVYLIRETHR